MLRLYVMWTTIYLPFNVLDILRDEKGILHGTLSYIRNIIFVGSYGPLWYLPALVFAVVLISILVGKKVPLKTILIVSGIFYALGLLAQSWFGLIVPLRESVPWFWSALKVLQKIIVTTRDGLFEGFLFVAIGMLFAFKQIKLQRNRAFIGFVLSMLLLFVEAFVTKYFDLLRARDMYIFLVPAVFFLFLIVLHTELRPSGGYHTLRQMSTLVFFVHMWVSTIVNKALEIIHIGMEDTGLRFFLTLFISMAVAYLVIRLQRRKRFAWLKYLYT